MAETTAVFQSLPIDQIRPAAHQARKTFDDEALNSLSQSMKEEGLIQPITVRLTGEGRGEKGEIVNPVLSPLTHLSSPLYELVSGERRLRAAKLLGWTAIDAKIIQTVSEADAAAKGMVENLQRE